MFFATMAGGDADLRQPGGEVLAKSWHLGGDFQPLSPKGRFIMVNTVYRG